MHPPTSQAAISEYFLRSQFSLICSCSCMRSTASRLYALKPPRQSLNLPPNSRLMIAVNIQFPSAVTQVSSWLFAGGRKRDTKTMS